MKPNTMIALLLLGGMVLSGQLQAATGANQIEPLREGWRFQVEQRSRMA